MSNLYFVVYADLHHFCSAPEVSCFFICETQVPGSICFSLPVPDLEGDGKPLLVVLDGLPDVAEGSEARPKSSPSKELNGKAEYN